MVVDSKRNNFKLTMSLSSSSSSGSSSTDDDDTPILTPCQPPAAPAFHVMPPLPPNPSALKRFRSGERVPINRNDFGQDGDFCQGNDFNNNNFNNAAPFNPNVSSGNNFNVSTTNVSTKAKFLEKKPAVNMPKVQLQTAGNIKYNKETKLYCVICVICYSKSY